MSRRPVRPLAGQVVLVTGAARGIGAAFAAAAAERGARLALVGLEPSRLSALAARLGGVSGGHVWAECDVTDQQSLDAAVASVVAATGGLDAVVANAGIANNGTVAVNPPDALARTVEVNLTGVMRTVSATLPHVVARRGYYLLTSSVAAFTVLPGMAAYCASKAGVEQFGNALRLELAHRGVAVGVAHPCWVDTDLVRDQQAESPVFRQAIAALPRPLSSVQPVSSVAAAYVDAISRRRRRVYVPRSMAAIQALRSLVLSPLGDVPLARSARRLVPRLEADVRARGTAFGRHSAARDSWSSPNQTS